MSLLGFFDPWERSYLFCAVMLAFAVLYWRGARRLPVSKTRQAAFWTGMAMFYVSLHTRVDYYAEHQFFVHRIQHLVLHHLAPLVTMAAFPGSVLKAGLPLAWRMSLRRICRTRALRIAGAVLLNPAVITIGFIASVLVWLIPSVQFVAMLDWRIYLAMNWSVAITGLMYWWMVLDHRPHPPSRTRPGYRVMSPIVTMTPQILAGALITFTSIDLYPIFTLCGRAFTGITPALDQSLGGLILWVPAAMIEAVGALIALRRMMRLSEGASAKRTQRRPLRVQGAA